MAIGSRRGAERGPQGGEVELTYVGQRAMLVYRLPLNEVVYDFYDRPKSYSRGYASFDYHLDGYADSDLVKLSILINGEPVDSLSLIVHRSMAESRGRGLCVCARSARSRSPRKLFWRPSRWRVESPRRLVDAA